MKWETHIGISKQVMEELGMRLSSEESSMLKEGAIAPDKFRGQNVSHHYGRSAEIRNHLVKARLLHLQSDMPRMYYELGNALHYIQDSYVSFASFYGQKHESWEQSIEDSYLVSDKEAMIQNYVKDDFQRKRCLYLSKELSKEVHGRDETLRIATLSGIEQYKSWAHPKADLNLAYMASYIVSKSIIDRKDNPTLDAQLLRVLSDHERLLSTTEIETSNEIIRLIRERDELKTKIVPSNGFTSKIKNWFTGRKIRSVDRKAIADHSAYLQRTHLDNVAKAYLANASKTASNYGGWYNFQIPTIDPGKVPIELVEIDSFCNSMKMGHDELVAYLKEKNVPTYFIGNYELVRKSSLSQISGS